MKLNGEQRSLKAKEVGPTPIAWTTNEEPDMPPLPHAGEQFSYRAIGWTTRQRKCGKRQVRWEDDATSHLDNPEVVGFPDGQRFECVATYTYTGSPVDPFEATGPVVSDVRPLEALVDDGSDQALWDELGRKSE